ncbi:MAG: sigma-70 family RNA polymerase sigma factor [Actinomycetota bacterium]|nr:sigma-70 family RNA polymerase sigma factor [Actinomycetota bacterium]
MGRKLDVDTQMVERLQSGDEAALREAIRLYGGVVLGMARRILLEPAMAEEVAQDTFLALWRRPGAFDPSRGSLQSFLLGVARNKAIDLVRKEEARSRAGDLLMAEAETAQTVENPTDRSEERREVRDALCQLSEVQREAIVLAYFGGRTYREVAAELGIPEGTAKTRLRDGLIKLKDVLNKSGTAET